MSETDNYCGSFRCTTDWCRSKSHHLCSCRYINIGLALVAGILLIYGVVTWNDKYVTTCTILDYQYNNLCRFHFVTIASINCSVPTAVSISRLDGGDILCGMFGAHASLIVNKDKRFDLPCMVKTRIGWKQCPAKLSYIDVPVFDYRATITDAQFCVLFGLITTVWVLIYLVATSGRMTPPYPYIESSSTRCRK